MSREGSHRPEFVACVRKDQSSRMTHSFFLVGFTIVIMTALRGADGGRTGRVTPPADIAGNSEVRQIMETYAGHGTLQTGTKPLPPNEALKQLTPRADLAIDLIAAE